MVNSSIWIYSKTGSLLGTYNSAAFFDSPSGWYVSDPQVKYDPSTGRWFVSAMAFEAGTSPFPGGYVYLAISTSGDPLGTWNVYTVDSNNSEIVYDQPMFSITQDKIIITWDDYKGSFAASSYIGQETWVIQKSQVLSGSSSPLMDSLFGAPDPTRWRLYPVTENTEINTGYLVYNTFNASAGLITVTGTPANSDVTYSQDNLAITQTNNPPSASQPGLPSSIDTDSAAFISGVYFNGYIWVGGNDGCIPSSDSVERSCLRLIEISLNGTSPSILEDFDASSYGTYLYYPGISADTSGDVIISFTESSSSIYPGSYVIVQPAGSPAGYLSNPIATQLGQTTYNNDQGVCGGTSGSPSRWGDYSGAALDPSNTNNVWVASEYASNSVLSETDGCSWSTQISQVSFSTATAPAQYFPLSPTRICDTRPTAPKNQCTGKTLGPNSVLTVSVAGQASIPTSGVTAIVANLTAVDTTATSYLTVYPAGNSPPLASNLNWMAGETIPNLVTVQLGTSGEIDIYNHAGSVDVIVDVEGYYAQSTTSAGLFNPISPLRVCDTRATAPQNQCTGKTLSPNSVLNVKITPQGSLPASGIEAIAANVTAVGPTAPAGGYLTVYPEGTTQPLASNLNFSYDETIANRVVVPINQSTGEISIYNYTGYTNVIIDINGWFTNSSLSTGYKFSSISPVRICDTRSASTGVIPNQCNTGSNGILGPGSTLNVQVSSVDGIPSQNIFGVVANVTVTQTTAVSYLTIYPTGQTRPLASDINWYPNETIANLTLVELSTSGAFSAYNAAVYTQVIVDVVGWYS